MEEQSFDQMQVPEHMAKAEGAAHAGEQEQGGNRPPGGVVPEDAAASAEAAAAAAAAEGLRRTRATHEANIGEFVARAQAKEVDISDIELASITPEKLREEAQRRLA